MTSLHVTTCIRLKNTLDATVDPGTTVRLMLHDWGCYLGLLFCNTYPERVSRMVVIDVGIKEQSTVTVYEGLVIASYQWALATAFIIYKLLGETAGSFVFILSTTQLLSL